MPRFGEAPQRSDVQYGAIPQTNQYPAVSSIPDAEAIRAMLSPFAAETQKPELTASEIAGAQTVDQLIKTIERTSGIRNSAGELVPAKSMTDLLRGLQQVAGNPGLQGFLNTSIKQFTRSGGLQEKVRQLLLPDFDPREQTAKILESATRQMQQAQSIYMIESALDGVTGVEYKGKNYTKADLDSMVKSIQDLLKGNKYEDAKAVVPYISNVLGMREALARVVTIEEAEYKQRMQQQSAVFIPAPIDREMQGIDRRDLLMDVTKSPKDRLGIVGSFDEVKMVMSTTGGMKNKGVIYTNDQVMGMIDRVADAVKVGTVEEVTRVVDREVPPGTLHDVLGRVAMRQLAKR